MEIFIKGIPESTTRADLKKFVLKGMRWHLAMPFSEKARLVAWHILRLRHEQLDRIEWHGLVEVQPDGFAKKVIRRLNGKQLNGKRVVVRKFVKRKNQNEKRKKDALVLKPDGESRRSERRREALIVEKKIGPNATVPLEDD